MLSFKRKVIPKISTAIFNKASFEKCSCLTLEGPDQLENFLDYNYLVQHSYFIWMNLWESVQRHYYSRLYKLYIRMLPWLSPSCLQIFPVKRSKNVSRSDLITGVSYNSGGPISELLYMISQCFVTDPKGESSNRRKAVSENNKLI